MFFFLLFLFFVFYPVLCDPVCLINQASLYVPVRGEKLNES
jgi:hypothetical protein